MDNKLDSFLRNYQEIMANDPKSGATYTLNDFLELNEASHLLSKALSDYFYNNKSYQPFSFYSFQLDQDNLTIASCVESSEQLKKNEVFYLESDKDFFYGIDSFQGVETKLVKLVVKTDSGECFIELPINFTTYSVKKIRSYKKNQSNLMLLVFSGMGDFKSLDWKHQSILARKLHVYLNKKNDFWTNEGKQTLFLAWLDLFKSEQTAKIA